MIPEIELVRHPDTGELIPEEWRTIPNYLGYYSISNYGRIKSINRSFIRKNGAVMTIDERLMKPYKCNGYWRIVLIKMMVREKLYVHRLVGEIFIDNTNAFGEINHKDSNRLNPFVLNLEWVTPRMNVTHMKINKMGITTVGAVRKKNRKRWQSAIILNGEYKYIGTYDTEKEAGNAYQNALNEHIKSGGQ